MNTQSDDRLVRHGNLSYNYFLSLICICLFMYLYHLFIYFIALGNHYLFVCVPRQSFLLKNKQSFRYLKYQELDTKIHTLPSSFVSNLQSAIFALSSCAVPKPLLRDVRRPIFCY